MTLRAGDFGDMWEKLDTSATMIQLWDETMITDPEHNVAPLLQFAYMVMQDKPIIVCAKRGQHIPDHVRRVADELVIYSTVEEMQQGVAAALKRWMLIDKDV